MRLFKWMSDLRVCHHKHCTEQSFTRTHHETATRDPSFARTIVLQWLTLCFAMRDTGSQLCQNGLPARTIPGPSLPRLDASQMIPLQAMHLFAKPRSSLRAANRRLNFVFGPWFPGRAVDQALTFGASNLTCQDSGSSNAIMPGTHMSENTSWSGACLLP